MIQRIQSVYLLLAAVLNIAAFFNPLYNRALVDPQAWINLGFTVALILACLSAIVTIFFYKDRNKQIKFTNVAIAFQVIAFGWGVGILISLGGIGTFMWNEAVGALFSLIALIAVVLARKKIRDDQELVRSMDRIR